MEVSARAPKPAIRSNSRSSGARGPSIKSTAFDNSSARSARSERNGVWAVSGNTSGWFGAERVAGPPLKDSSNTQQNSLGAPAHTDNSAKRTPKTHFFLFFQNSDMLFLLRYEPKGLDKTKGRKYNFPLPPGGPDSQKQSLPTKKTRIFMNFVLSSSRRKELQYQHL